LCALFLLVLMATNGRSGQTAGHRTNRGAFLRADPPGVRANHAPQHRTGSGTAGRTSLCP
jgi:hypothetical protein